MEARGQGREAKYLRGGKPGEDRLAEHRVKPARGERTRRVLKSLELIKRTSGYFG
mgnify:CR=1 FL=1